MFRGKPLESSGVFDYLSISPFMENAIAAHALATAFHLRLVDFLLDNQPTTASEIRNHIRTTEKGLHLLLRLLEVNNVIEEAEGLISLNSRFQELLRYRDLLEAKLELAGVAMADFMGCFSSFIRNSGQFSKKSRIFDMFDYGRCFEFSLENYAHTKRWMRITTALTRYEAEVCIKYHDFGPYRSLLDVGGNSGEFVLRICRKYPALLATVFDLPLVCKAGREHLQCEPEIDRIRFIEGNALTDELPRDFDIVVFKSMLHDWPEKEASQLLQKAGKSVKPGGELLIFERGPLELQKIPAYEVIPFILFSHSFRSPTLYEKELVRMCFEEILVQDVQAETRFFLLTAKKRDYRQNS
jgi:SAM-dependent methyltransferase